MLVEISMSGLFSINSGDDIFPDHDVLLDDGYRPGPVMIFVGMLFFDIS
jgi:hypothetical protein